MSSRPDHSAPYSPKTINPRCARQDSAADGNGPGRRDTVFDYSLNIRERTPVAIGRRLTISSYRDRRRIDADVSRPRSRFVWGSVSRDLVDEFAPTSMTLRPSPICRLEACRRDEAESRVAATSMACAARLPCYQGILRISYHLVLGRTVGGKYGKYGNAIVAATSNRQFPTSSPKA